jgi:hypothetical protein
MSQQKSLQRRVVSVIAALGLIAVATTGCGTDEPPVAATPSVVKVVTTAPAATPQPRKPRVRTRTRTRTHVVYVQSQPTVVRTVAAPAATTGGSCGDGTVVGATTTCPFAANVRAAYMSHGPGLVRAYSPVTRRTYVMSCSSGAPVVCTGGDGASVSF